MSLTIRRYKGRYWAVYEGEGDADLLVVTVYKRGAQAVCLRLSGKEGALVLPEPTAPVPKQQGGRTAILSASNGSRPFLYATSRKAGRK